MDAMAMSTVEDEPLRVVASTDWASASMVGSSVVWTRRPPVSRTDRGMFLSSQSVT
jgi:hypothetical protein